MIQLSKIKRNKNITKKSVRFSGIKTPLYLENKLKKFLRFMAKTQKERFENKVLKAMNVSTIKKFEDAQVGNYVNIYNKLFKEFQKSINNQFNKDRLNNFVTDLFKNVSDYNERRFYENVNNQIGVDMNEILATDGLNSFKNAKKLQSLDIIEKFKNDTLIAYKTNVLRRMSAGSSLDDLYKEVKKNTNFSLNRADLIARNEIKTFNAELSKTRAKNTGIKKAIWRTAKDERVRSCHHRFAGQEYEIGKGLFCKEMNEWQEPGEAINCRCYAEFIVEF